MVYVVNNDHNHRIGQGTRYMATLQFDEEDGEVLKNRYGANGKNADLAFIGKLIKMVMHGGKIPDHIKAEMALLGEIPTR